MKPTLIFTAAFAFSLAANSATAATVIYGATLTGASEQPAVVTSATGTATLTFDNVSGVWSLTGSFSGLSSASNNAHIHGPLDSPTDPDNLAAVFAGLTFPSGVTSGTLSGSGTFNASQLAQLNATTPAPAGLAGGRFYVNVHSVNNPSGEIRGTLVAVPEPGTISLAGLAGLALLRRRR